MIFLKSLGMKRLISTRGGYTVYVNKNKAFMMNLNLFMESLETVSPLHLYIKNLKLVLMMFGQDCSYNLWCTMVFLAPVMIFL